MFTKTALHQDESLYPLDMWRRKTCGGVVQDTAGGVKIIVKHGTEELISGNKHILLYCDRLLITPPPLTRAVAKILRGMGFSEVGITFVLAQRDFGHCTSIESPHMKWI
jgi:hypothetical protein